MSFNIGLSGIRAASSDLNITGNNIANASTVGFKSSRAEFGDIYAASILGTGSNAQGSGVVLNNVAQIFTQGNINYTENSLDLAINGNGFFVTSNNGALSYTRAGYFGTNQEGFIVNNNGERLQGYGVDPLTGKVTEGVPTDLRVDTRAANPNPTSKVASTLNLNSASVRLPAWESAFKQAHDAVLAPSDEELVSIKAQSETARAAFDSVISDPNSSPEEIAAAKADAQKAYQDTYDAGVTALLSTRTPEQRAAAETAGQVAATASFDPADSSTFNSSTSVNVYDSQGNAHVMTKYFVKTDSNSWDMHVMIGGKPVDLNDVAGPAQLKFSDTGQLQTQQPIAITGWAPMDKAGQPTGAISPTSFELNLNGSTQYSAAFAVTAVSQDGYTTGDLAGLEIDDQGMLIARYTNGQTKTQGQLVLATFANQQGLKPLGDTAWAQSSDSGEAVIGAPGTGTQGLVQSGALEQSNVDLSEMLINLIVAQRNYQANAKTIQTEDAVTQTIINLR
ncbi:flagellar hook protein FlgE [Halopseudomonas litoralis]|uniref:Flagellar hook protein FlgE n=1 Tax=Halopseudomonas litoralis TaxID=797277 RepID=A0A1H1T1M9_9GAMM|nr:flagellar hook protein FlgE [Halopseudomonas litoralis]SDS53876.1 flagellar hook protein FlgE [Halopseudomonas litoralis]